MKFLKNHKGVGQMASAGAIIGLVIAAYVMAYTLPDAMVALANETEYSGAGDAVINIATIVVPIMALFACILIILPPEVKTKIGMWYKPKILMNTRGSNSISAAGAIIGIVLAIYVMAYTLPATLVAMSCSTSYSGAGTAVINIATVVLPIMILFACVMYLLPSELKTKIGL